MRKYLLIIVLLQTIISLILPTNVSAFKGSHTKDVNASHVRVASVFGDNMVLQRNQKLPVWGTADSGGVLKVKINNQSQNSYDVQKDGKWQVNSG